MPWVTMRGGVTGRILPGKKAHFPATVHKNKVLALCGAGPLKDWCPTMVDTEPCMSCVKIMRARDAYGGGDAIVKINEAIVHMYEQRERKAKRVEWLNKYGQTILTIIFIVASISLGWILTS